MKKVALIAGALVLGVTSIAVASTRDAAVPKASLTSTVKVHDGKPLGARSVGHIQLKNSVIDCQKLVPSLRSAICSLSLIPNGGKGDKGDKGPSGINGVDGKNGADGAAGLKGDKGDKGPKGQDASVEYGIAQVLVSRGGKPAGAWATYSTRLGSPVGDTTGGTFRFTCSDANAPCKIAVQAGAVSPTAGSVNVYPRMLVYKQDYNNGGPEVYCEYADGSANAAPAAIAKTPGVAYSALKVNIGGSDDCGLNGPAGDVDVITVPAGYYDVQSTFAFLP